MSTFDINTRCKLAFALSSAEYDKIKVDGTNLSTKKSLSDLLSLKPPVYLLNRNQVLFFFLSGLLPHSKRSKNMINDHGEITPPLAIENHSSDTYRFIKVVESCMGLTAQVNVLPFHFREIVLVHTITVFKLATNLLASSSPFASYNTLTKWYDTIATEKVITSTFKNTDLVVVFDNNQIMQRRWQILIGNTAKCNVLTMVISTPIGNGHLQSDKQFAPSMWKYNVTEQMINDLKNVNANPSYKAVKFKHLHFWLSGVIATVVSDQKQVTLDDSRFIADCIDAKVEETLHLRIFKICTNCVYREVPKRARVYVLLVAVTLIHM